MAALSDRHDEPVVDLRHVSADHLVPLLERETLDWRTELDWDFRHSADLVRRFVHLQALNGFALLQGSRVVGYSYFVCEDGKGLIGDLFLAREYSTVANENVLLRAVLDAIWRTPGVRRIESQLMMLSSPLDREVPQANWFRCYPRFFMEIPLGKAVKLPEKKSSSVAIFPWTEQRQDDTARLISHSYQGHIDSLINDQYRSFAGARRFLTNIVQYPGCGTFFAPASYAAIAGHELRGISLSSLVASDVGHITQVCVSPSERNTGLGYELMRRSLLALAAHGCRSVSLTVTSANSNAVRLYERMGLPRSATSPRICGSRDSAAASRIRYCRNVFAMAWFTREKPGVEGSGEGEKKVRTEGLWLKCESCGQIIWKKALDENLQVCPQVRAPFPHRRPRAAGDSVRRRRLRRARRRPDLHRSAAVRRFQAVHRPAGRHAASRRRSPTR